MREAADRLLAYGPKNIIITLGKKGSYLADKNSQTFVPSLKVNAIDTTGAGDAYNCGLVCALGEGKPLNEAVRFATAVGALNTTKVGSAPAMPYRVEIEALI